MNDTSTRFRPSASKAAKARDAVLRVLSDLAPHNTQELVAAGGGDNATGRVNELRDLGYIIHTVRHVEGTHATYRLESQTPGPPRASQARLYLTHSEGREYVQCGTVSPSLDAKIHAAFERLDAKTPDDDDGDGEHDNPFLDLLDD